MNPKIKFGVLTLVIVAALGWLAMDGINEAATYYVTIAELEDMQEAAAKRIRVGGDVVPNSIVRSGDNVAFTIEQAEEGVAARTLSVVYTGQDPLPDTFRDRAQALCDGKMRPDGVFEAQKIQAKCASKYEVNPGEGQSPTYETAPAASSTTD